MPTYATLADLIDCHGETAIAQLTDRESGRVIDAGIVQRAIAAAQGEIDGYLIGRYQLPLDPVPALIGRRCVDIAYYLLHGERATEEVRQPYDDAVRDLRSIADGKMRLAAPAPVVTSGDATVQAGARISHGRARMSWGGE